MTHVAAPPLWVLEKADLDSGAKLCLIGLWSYAPFGEHVDQVHVWPSREGLAHRTGQTYAAVKKQLSKLSKLGLIERNGDGWSLCLNPAPCVSSLANVDGAKANVDSKGDCSPRPLQSPAPTVPGGGDHSPRPRPLQSPPPGTTVPPELNKNLHEPSRGTSRARDEECAVQGDDRITTLAERHFAIQAASRVDNSTSDGPPPPRLTRDYIRAIEGVGVGAWSRELMISNWESELAEVVDQLGLTPDQVAAVLRAWERQHDLLTPAQRAKAAQDKTLPDRRALWWWKSRPWLTRTLEQIESAEKPRQVYPRLPPESEPEMSPEEEERAVAELWATFGRTMKLSQDDLERLMQ